MTKKCAGCGREKNITSYYKYAKSADGLNPKCKICCSQYQKKIRKDKTTEKVKDKLDDNRHMTLRFTSQQDYCSMYELLSLMGYDIQKNIHKQFVNKFSLEYQKRTDGWRNDYTLEDCDCETFSPK